MNGRKRYLEFLRGLGRAPQRAWEFITAKSLRIRRHGARVSIQKSVEPVELPVQTFDQVLWLAGAGQVVVLARKENDLGGDAEMFERAKPLLSLLDRHPIVV